MPTEILHRIHQIVLPTPFPVGPVNCYLSSTVPITLIDTGTRWEASQEKLSAELQELGMSLCDIERIIITHPHPDHCGFAAEIVSQSGAEVWTHRLNETLLAPTEQSREKSHAFYRQLFVNCGMPELQLEEYFQSRRESRSYTEPVRTTRTLAEGDQIEFAEANWTVYHTPGHSGGLICLFQPELRVLLANDHILRSISSNPIVEPDPDGGPRPHRLVEYLHHLQRMADLDPVVVWTGHGAEIHDLQKIVRQRIRFHQRRAEYILDMLASRAMTAFEIAQAIFGTRVGFDVFLSLSETIGHLDWLEEQGKIQSEDRNGVAYWNT